MKIFVLLLLLASPNFLLASISSDRRHLVRLINQQRFLHQQLPLKIVDKPAQISAKLYLDELVASGSRSHIDHKGNDSLTRYRRQGGTALMVGEILGGASTLDRVMDAWLKSPAHYQAIIAPQWSSIAIALELHEGRYNACVIFTNTLFKKINYTALNHQYRVRACPYFTLSDITLSLNHQQLLYTKKRNYFMIEQVATQGDYITLSNGDNQGDTVMIKGRG